MATANILFPALSTAGFIRSTPEKCDYLLSHFFLSEYSQTQLHFGHVASLQWLIQRYQNKMPELVDAVQQTLTTYFGRYFPKVEVEVQYDDLNDTTSVVGLSIFIKVTDFENKDFTVAKLAEIIDSKINKILDLNNTGTTSS